MSIPVRRLETAQEIYYPVSDGKPMGESDRHIDQMIYCKEALRFSFEDRPDVYIASNNFLYWEEGNPKAVVSPDVYVVFGVSREQRDCYMAWKEGGKLPSVVIEVTSRSTRGEDTGKKMRLYEQTLRVPEYFRFDPRGDYLRPRLQGSELVNGEYVLMPMLVDRLHSKMLGLDLVVDGDTMRFYDPKREQWLFTPLENARRAEENALRAEAAEAQIARLQAEIEALRRQREPGR